MAHCLCSVLMALHLRHSRHILSWSDNEPHAWSFPTEAYSEFVRQYSSSSVGTEDLLAKGGFQGVRFGAEISCCCPVSHSNFSLSGSLFARIPQQTQISRHSFRFWSEKRAKMKGWNVFEAKGVPATVRGASLLPWPWLQAERETDSESDHFVFKVQLADFRAEE
jgi:hypothetical protein